jgi:hypothetical protein
MFLTICCILGGIVILGLVAAVSYLFGTNAVYQEWNDDLQKRVKKMEDTPHA